ncbi:hypothetical protein EKO04_007546 [Ascochyta lentis]|uniref:Uncharacterized protein n=1 Tax=Ascochyta lentis TaxID=205686 RepID=A0A8H7J303_9PLEO|nr:hypothetical protein EKO04_007546 [Ascochyta lentis]
MAKSAKYYNADDFNNYKRRLGKCLPPRTNVLAAACHIQSLFDANKFTFGFMGGLAMLCQGYKREMPDLHIAYDDKDFDRLKSKLESDQRVRLPTGANPLLPFKILVWTGPEYKDQGCTENASIELDLVPSGSCGTPRAGVLNRNLVQLSLNTSNGQKRPFKCLNTLFLVATMLSYCSARDLLWDPRKDLLFLCKNQSASLQRIRTELDLKEVRELFLDPPPIMAVTPPAPQTLPPFQPESLLSEHSNEARTSRSRYRNSGGPKGSSSGMSDQRPANGPRPQSIEHLQDPRQLSKIVGLQSVDVAKPQPVSAAAAVKQVRRSMPDLTAVHNTPTTLRAGAQTIETVSPSRHYHATFPASNVPSLPASTSQYQNRANSQLDCGGNFQPVHMRVKSETEIQIQNFSANKKTIANSMVSNRTISPGIPVQEIRSQKRSLHVVSSEIEEVSLQQYSQDRSINTCEGLHVVDPDGINTALERPHNTAYSQAQHQRHSSAPPPTISDLIFELEATVPVKHTVVAELSADPVVQSRVEHTTTRDPESFNVPASFRPSYPHTVSAPLGSGSLPASLVAGGASFHGHRQSLSHSESANESASGFSKQTNAYRYSSFVFPESGKDGNSSAALNDGIAPTYKAYRPFVVPDEHRSAGSLRPTDDPIHQRNASNDSTASYDSNKLAQEYRELLDFEGGFGTE